MGRVVVEVELANYRDVIDLEEGRLDATEVRRVRLPAVVDTGSNYLVLPKSAVRQLGSLSAGSVTVRYADRRARARQLVKDVQVELLGRRSSFRAIVEPDRKDVLIGAMVLEDLDLLVDCGQQRVIPRDPKGIIAEVE
jgi:predicted aspartyl protease